MSSIAYVALFSLAGVLSVVMTGVGCQYRTDPVGRWFVGLVAAAGLWSFADAAAVGAATFERAAFWYAVTWVLYGFVVFFLLLFTLEYAGYERWVTRRRLPLFLAWPVATSLAIATNGAHHLVWSGARPVTNGTVRYVAVTPGPWFVADVVYGFGVAFLCLGLLLRRLFDARPAYRKQMALLVVGVALPAVVATVSIFAEGLVIDPTPLSFAAAAVLLLWAVRRYDFLDVVPVAHRVVLEHVDDAVVVVGPDGELAEFNAAAAALFGLSDAAVGRSAAAALGTEVTDAVAGEGTYAAAVGDERRQFEVDSVEIRDDRGVERGTLYLFHDVTERHRREQWFRTLTENATDVTVVVDADAAVRYVGESVGRVVGVSPEALDHEGIVSRLHDEDRETARTAFEGALDRPGETVRFECRVRDADGDRRTFDVRAKNLLGDPVIGGVVVNAHDVTERRAYERRLERQNAQLDEFASVISHDLRNPLSVAEGYLDLFRDDPNPEYADRIERAHERMRTIISDMLALARSGSQVGETGSVDLRGVAEEAWANVATCDGRLDVAGEATVDADRTRLLHLFENLFRNAVDHAAAGERPPSDDPVVRGSADDRANPDGAPEGCLAAPRDDADAAGDPSVTVRVGPLADDAGFYVEDDGPGVPPDERERVFESGFSTSEAGTGFGLAIVRAVAEAHGWEASCVAADGGGARFELRGADVYDPQAE